MMVSESDLTLEFDAAAQTEPGERLLAEVYKTGVMYKVNDVPVVLDNTSLGLIEGRILWHICRRLRPQVVIETGFGRGESAAFFLAALSSWKGRLISIDPAFKDWAQDIGTTYLDKLGLKGGHTLIEEPSELALAKIISESLVANLKFSYIDGSHHFDGTLIDFMYLDRLTEPGGIIAIDDAHAPAVRTVASFVAHNLPYQLHYATSRLVLCKKLALVERDWSHFKPFQSSSKSDWDVHTDGPDNATVPGATFGSLQPTVE
jgi:predicted O-methyltransferase YrrM